MDRKGKRLGSILGLILLVGVCLNGIAYGNEFWLAIGRNLNDSSRDIFIASGPGATGAVTNSSGSFNVPFTIPPGGTVIVTVPSSLAFSNTSGVISNLGLKISADNHVIAYLIDANTPVASNDLAVLFPTTGIGTEYFIMAYGSDLEYSQFVIAASQDGTQVTINPSVATLDGHAAGVPFTIALNAFEAVQYLSSNPPSTNDLTGTIITSDKPISVTVGIPALESRLLLRPVIISGNKFLL